MLGDRKKTWKQMTRREIFSTLTAFIMIGGILMSLSIRDVVRHTDGLIIFHIAVVVFIAWAVGVTCFRGIRELRRRGKN
jgi:hypothetical protein